MVIRALIVVGAMVVVEMVFVVWGEVLLAMGGLRWRGLPRLLCRKWKFSTSLLGGHAPSLGGF